MALSPHVQKKHFKYKEKDRLKGKEQKRIYHADTCKKARVTILLSK